MVSNEVFSFISDQFSEKFVNCIHLWCLYPPQCTAVAFYAPYLFPPFTCEPGFLGTVPVSAWLGDQSVWSELMLKHVEPGRPLIPRDGLVWAGKHVRTPVSLAFTSSWALSCFSCTCPQSSPASDTRAPSGLCSTAYSLWSIQKIWGQAPSGCVICCNSLLNPWLAC